MIRSWIFILIATLAHAQAVVIRTSTLLDGKGHVLKNTDLTIEGGRISRIGAAKGKAAIDLSGMTVMPGWIDTHVHATWYFNQEGRLEQGGRGAKSTPQQAALYAAANLYATLMGGFTTVQSVGAELDGDLRAPDRRGRHRRTASAHLAAPGQREYRRSRANSRVRAQDEGRRRRCGEALRHRQHPRRRQNDDDAGADRGNLRRGKGAGTALAWSTRIPRTAPAPR